MEGRNSKGQFTKGHKFAKGRPKKPEVEELRKAIKMVEKKTGKKILEHFVERGFRNDSVLVALIKKLVADKIQTEGNLESDVRVRIELVGSDGDRPQGKSK